MIDRGKGTDKEMGPTWKLLTGAVCSVLLAFPVLPVEAAVTKAFVSISPQRYFVQKIGGDLVDVSVLVPAITGVIQTAQRRKSKMKSPVTGGERVCFRIFMRILWDFV